MLKRIILGLVSLTLYECIIWSSACGMPNNSTTHSQERITHYVKAFKNLFLCLYLCFLASESVWPYKFQAHVNQAIVTILYMHRLPSNNSAKIPQAWPYNSLSTRKRNNNNDNNYDKTVSCFAGHHLVLF